MVGIPGSGKTTLAKAEYSKHTHVSLDKNKDMPDAERSELIARYKREEALHFKLSANRMAECVMMHDALAAGRNVVIDNTNVSKKVRRHYVRLAHHHGAGVTAVFFQNTELAYERNAGRADNPGEMMVPEDVVDRFREDLEPPDESEGFDLIRVIRS